MHLHWNFTKNWQTLCARRVCVCVWLVTNIFIYASMRNACHMAENLSLQLLETAWMAQNLVVYLVFVVHSTSFFPLPISFSAPFALFILTFFLFIRLFVCLFRVHVRECFVSLLACVRACVRLCMLLGWYISFCCAPVQYELHRLFQFLFIVGELLYKYTKKMKTNLVFILFFSPAVREWMMRL